MSLNRDMMDGHPWLYKEESGRWSILINAEPWLPADALGGIIENGRLTWPTVDEVYAAYNLYEQKLKDK
jgi:hypothetical protein